MSSIKKTLLFSAVLFTTFLFVFAAQKERPQENKIQTPKKKNDYNVYSLDVPTNLNFAGERVPIEKPDVYERMDRELLVNTYWQSNGLLLIKRSQKYFPIIEPILEKYGIPNDFKYLAVIESGLTQAISSARAVGFWQILKNTGRELGLEVNDNVDERYHIIKSTEAACKYLLASKQKFGSWTLAAAAYNAGNRGIQKRLEDQLTSNYYDLLLGQETGRYVFRIVAVKQILSNANLYGFNYEKKHLYRLPKTYTIEVDSIVNNLSKFAQHFGISYKELKLANPWLREQKLNNASKKKYFISIPKT